MFYRYLLVFQVLVLALTGAASAELDDDIIFETQVGGGVYKAKRGPEKSSDGVVDITGVLRIGKQDEATIELDMALLSTIRGDNPMALEGEVSLKGKLMFSDRFGIEVSGLPFRYVRDNGYYELSAVVLSAVVKPVNSNGHQVEVKAGINPYTKRTYRHDLKGSVTEFDPVEYGDGFFYQPFEAEVYGAPDYDGSNDDVYFGGGLKYRTIYTSFDMAERSVRVPISVNYKFNDGSGRLTIKAEAYYVLRIGADSLRQTDRVVDDYYGYVSYSNVYWNRCWDPEDERYYQCNPYDVQYSGEGRVTEAQDIITQLASSKIFAHTVGGKAQATFRVFKKDVLEILLNGQIRAEFDSHVMDGAVGTERSSKRFVGTGGVIGRF